MNIEPVFIQNDKLPNPWQKSLGLEISEDERVIDSMKTNILLDNAIHVGSTGNPENEPLKQISCVRWTNSIYGKRQASLITLTHGNRFAVKNYVTFHCLFMSFLWILTGPSGTYYKLNWEFFILYKFRQLDR